MLFRSDELDAEEVDVTSAGAALEEEEDEEATIVGSCDGMEALSIMFPLLPLVIDLDVGCVRD